MGTHAMWGRRHPESKGLKRGIQQCFHHIPSGSISTPLLEWDDICGAEFNCLSYLQAIMLCIFHGFPDRKVQSFSCGND